MSYSFGDTKPGLLASTSPTPGSVTDPTQCPSGTHFMPDTREVGSPGTCLANLSPPGALAKLKTFWNASALNKAIVIAPFVIACLAVGYFRSGDAAEHGAATPNRRRRRSYRRNAYIQPGHWYIDESQIVSFGERFYFYCTHQLKNGNYYGYFWTEDVRRPRATPKPKKRSLDKRWAHELWKDISEADVPEKIKNNRPATPNHEARVYSSIEHRVRRASASDLRRMATWMVQSGGARDPEEKALLMRIRSELMRRHGVKLPGQAAMTANGALPAEVRRLKPIERNLLEYVSQQRSDVMVSESAYRSLRRKGLLSQHSLALTAKGQAVLGMWLSARSERSAAKTARVRAKLDMKPNRRRFRRNGYRVIGAGGLKVPQVFGAHHQAVAYGKKAFGDHNYVVEFVFNANRRRAT